MTLRFEVCVAGHWVPTRTAIILADGRLGFTLDGPCGPTGGVAKPPFFRQTEESARQPEFRRLCWNSLTPDERAAAVARMGKQPTF